MTFALLLLIVVSLSPAQGQDRTDERLADLETRVAVLETKADSLFSGTPPPIKEVVNTLSGSIRILGWPWGIGLSTEKWVYVITDSNHCEGYGPFADLVSGMLITVRNENGLEIGTTRLQRGTVDAFEGVPLGNACVLPFIVADLPDASTYEISLGNRGSVVFSAAELESMSWTIVLDVKL